MTQWTTPTFLMRFPAGTDFSNVTNMVCSIRQGQVLLRKTGTDLTVEENVVIVSLTQRESGQFKNDKIRMQVNWLYPDGARGCSNIVEVDVYENLLKEVME